MADPKLNVRIGADNKELNRGLKDSQKKVGQFEGMVKKAGLALVGAFAARQVLVGLKNLTMGLANTADRLLDLEQITGITTNTLQEYEYVAKIAGVNTEALANASMGLTQRLARATTEASPLNIALSQLGVSAKDASGALRGGEAIMEDVIDQLAQMENVTERNVLGSQIFAGAWKDMAPILSMGADGIAEVRKEAREMGLVMDKEALAKANELRVSMEKLSAQGRALGQDLGLALIPVLTKSIELFSKFVKGFKEVLGMNKFNVGAYAGGEIDSFLSSLSEVRDEEQRREAIIQRINEEFSNQQRIQQALADEAKNRYFIYGKQYRVAQELVKQLKGELDASIQVQQQLTDNLDVYGQIPEIVQEVVTTQGEVIAQLGQIAQIEQDIADEKTKYLNATSAIERAAHVNRLRQLQKEREAYEKTAEHLATLMGAGDIGAPKQAKSIGPGGRDGRGVSQISMDDSSIEMKDITEGVQESVDAFMNWENVATGAAHNVALGLMAMASDGKMAISDLIKQTLSQVVASLIASIITNVPFPANIPMAMGAGAIAGGLMNQIPAFADGGMVKSPTMAMFGEYAGARTNPEYALRQDQLQGVIRKAGANVSGEFRIRGQDLVATLSEANRRGKVF